MSVEVKGNSVVTTRALTLGEKRLLQLSKYLKTVVAKLPRRRFNMNFWANGIFKNKNNPICNTAACAAGWATNIFKELKLVMNYDKSEADITNAKTGETDTWVVLGEFFNLSPDQADELFLGHPDYDGDAKNDTPLRVANNLERFVLTGLLPDEEG